MLYTVNPASNQFHTRAVGNVGPIKGLYDKGPETRYMLHHDYLLKSCAEHLSHFPSSVSVWSYLSKIFPELTSFIPITGQKFFF